jgi:PAS domain S-box-containing protein
MYTEAHRRFLSKVWLAVGSGSMFIDQLPGGDALQIDFSVCEQILNAIPYSVFLSDLEGRFLYVNEIACKTRGYTRSELLKMHIDDLDVPEYAQVNRLRLEKVLDKRESSFESVHVCKDKSQIPVEVHSRLITLGDQKCVISTIRDISVRKEHEARLTELQVQQQAILNNIPDMAWIKDKKHRFIAVNKALASASGMEIRDMLGKTDLDYYPKDLAEQYVSDDLEVMKTGETKTTDERFLNSNGTMRWIETIKTPIYGEKNKIMGTTGIARDITQRKQIEEKLMESEKNFRLMAENAKDMIYRFRFIPKEEFEYLSPAVFTISGYSAEEFKADPGLGYKILHPDDKPVWKEMLNHKYDNLPVSFRWKRKDAKYIWVEQINVPFRDKNGNVVYLEGIARDITERKRVEEAFKESEEKYRGLVQNIKLAVFRTTPDSSGKILEANKALEEISGYAREELMNLEVVNLWASREEREEFIRRLALNPEKAVIISHMKKKDGTLIDAHMVAKAIKDANGQLLYIDGTIEDITERNLLQKQLFDLYEKEKKQREELQEEARVRGMFIDILAHELRTPLTPILISTGILKDVQTDKEGVQGKLTKNVYTSAKVLSRRLEELLEIARYSRGTFQLEKHPVDTGKYLKDVISRFKPSIDERGQTIQVEIADDFKTAEIDPSRLEQVIINLLSNASKFSPQNGRISFKARIQVDHLRVEISDEGIGITPEESQRIFQPYHRVEQDRLKFPGLGLGLAVAKQIVEAHGGKIWVDSQLDHGSTFIFVVPLKSNPTPAALR